VGCITDTGLQQADTTELTAGFHTLMLELQQRLLAANSFSWAYFSELGGGAPFRNSSAACKSFFRENATALYGEALMMSLAKPSPGSLLKDLATFLLIRGPYAWLGYGWQGCGPTAQLPPEVLRDVGVPLSNFSEVSPGFFQRQWSKATVSLNCSDTQGSVQWH
jgi:hypothetical protein